MVALAHLGTGDRQEFKKVVTIHGIYAQLFNTKEIKKYQKASKPILNNLSMFTILNISGRYGAVSVRGVNN